MIRSFAYGLILLAFLLPSAIAQTTNVCITSQPKPKLPADFGQLDAQTRIIFKVEFRSDKMIGKIAQVSGHFIPSLENLAFKAVKQIKFVPKMVDGSPVTSFKLISYSYSYQFAGWRVDSVRDQEKCGHTKPGDSTQ